MRSWEPAASFFFYFSRFRFQEVVLQELGDLLDQQSMPATVQMHRIDKGFPRTLAKQSRSAVQNRDGTRSSDRFVIRQIIIGQISLDAGHEDYRDSRPFFGKLR